MKLRVKKLLFILILAVALIVALVIYCTGGTGGGSNSHTVQSTLALSEVMTSNKGSVPDENGNYPDWVELKNTGSTRAKPTPKTSSRTMDSRVEARALPRDWR